MSTVVVLAQDITQMLPRKQGSKGCEHGASPTHSHAFQVSGTASPRPRSSGQTFWISGRPKILLLGKGMLLLGG